MSQEQQVQITPLAMLAAIIFNVEKTASVMIKPDDSTEEVEVQAKCVGIEQTDDAVVCIIPMEKIMHYATTMYDFQFKVEEGVAIVSFEKHVYTGADIYGANGTRIPKESLAIKELMERLK